METPCNSYKMDMTDPTLGMEQRCKNCQLAKKLHNLTNSVPNTTGQGNKVSDLAKKFSQPNQQPVGPSMQNSANAFANALKINVQQKKETNSNQQTNQSIPQNPPAQIENQFKKTSSQIIQNDPPIDSPSQPIQFERQNVQVIDSKQDGRVSIETPPPQKISNNPFLQQDKLMKESGRSSTHGYGEQKQPYQPKPFGKHEEQPKQVHIEQKQQPLQSEPQKEQHISQPQQITTQHPQQNIIEPIPCTKIETVIVQKPEEPKHPVQDHPKPQTNGNVLVKEKAQNLMMFGFGAPPPKKVIEQKESESVIEERMINRPHIPKKHQRTTQEITFDDTD